MAQLTDAQLTSEANVIKNETNAGANTADRVGTMFIDSIDSKINIDAISTDTALGTSDTLVPSQNAVKTYVDNHSSSGWGLTGNAGTNPSTNFIGTTDNNDLVLKRNGLLRFKITTPSAGVNPALVGVGGLKVYTSSYDSGFNYPNIELDPDQGRLNMTTSAGKTVSIYADNVTDNRNLQLPDASGTLAIEDYKVYTALLNGTSPTPTVLKNTLGTTINWSNPSNGLFRGTVASGTPFTSGKTWIIVGNYTNGTSPYIPTGKQRNASPTTAIDIYMYLYDGTLLTTPNVTNLSIEIRVYP